MLSWRFVEISDLSEHERGEMIALYRHYNDCTEAQAWAHLTSAGLACLLTRPRTGELEAFFFQAEQLIEIDGEPLLLVKFGSFYARRSARGDASLVLSMLHGALRSWRRHPRVRCYAVSDVSEDSFRTYRRSLRQLWSLRHENLPARERLILEHAIDLCSGDDGTFDPDRGVFRYTHPLAKLSPRADEAGREFRRLVPGATEYEHLLVVGELSLRNMFPTLPRALRRFGRKLRERVRCLRVPDRLPSSN